MPDYSVTFARSARKELETVSLKRDGTISPPETGTSLLPVELVEGLVEFNHFAAGDLFHASLEALGNIGPEHLAGTLKNLPALLRRQ